VDDADWLDIDGVLREWDENPPVELFARAYFQYEPPAATVEGDVKFFGDDLFADGELPRDAPSIAGAPPEIQQIFEHFKETRLKRGAR
jgi:hypothetical protein